MNKLLSNVNIGTKVYGLIGILLLAIAAASGSGIYQMSKIGDELHAVTTQDMPLTTILTTITTHQLEQAVLFERGVAIGARLATDPSQKGHFVEVEHEFVELGHKVEAEIKQGEELLADAVKHATSEEARKEFEHLLVVMKEVEKEHHQYELLLEQALGLMENGEITNPGEVVDLIEAQETKIDHELEAALVEIEKFTESAMKRVESHEKSSMIMSLIIAGIAIALGLTAGVIVSRGTVAPINAMTVAMGELAEDNLEIDIPAQGRKDEVGLMAESMQVFKDKLIRTRELEAERATAREAQQKRAQVIENRTSEFDKVVTDALGAVTASSTEMQGSSESMSAMAVETNAQATAVAAAAEQASANVQTVAAAAQELSSSITEISRQVSKLTTIAGNAVDEVEAANGQVQGLAEAANKIGEVLSLIADIAAQTNLLALNATIEAARAGDAGKGIAVVASEVKNLANQTAKATEEIGAQIGGIQNATKDAVSAIAGIGKVIGEINEISTAIAAAVEEQGAATQEIAVNVEQASTGTREVTSNITQVTRVTGETGQTSAAVLESAKSLTKQADALRSQVDSFLADIKAA